MSWIEHYIIINFLFRRFMSLLQSSLSSILLRLAFVTCNIFSYNNSSRAKGASHKWTTYMYDDEKKQEELSLSLDLYT
jgi:ABC-type protease/lipase transport system fused ATPase/permease subunit